MKKTILNLSVLVLITSACRSEIHSRVDSVAFYLQRNDLLRARRHADMEAFKNRHVHYAWFQKGEVYLLIARDKGREYMITPEAAFTEGCACIHKAVSLASKTGAVTPAYISRVQRCHDGFMELGHDKYRAEEYEAALDYYDKAIELTRLLSQVSKKIMFDTLAIFHQASAMEKTGNTEGAKKNYLQLMSMRYRHPDVYSNLAFLYRIKEEYGHALKILENGLKIFPHNKQLLTDWVNLSILLGRQQELLREVKQKTEQFPHNADLYFILATIYDNMNMIPEAEYYYKKTFEIDTGYVYARYNLAVMYYNAAMDKNKQLNNIDRNSELFRNTLADRNMLLRRSEALFRQVVRINQKEVEKILRHIQRMLS